MTPINKSFTSGFGQLHTNEFDPDKPNKILKPYLAIDWDAIQELVDHPQQVDKTQAQWLIPSTHPSRSFKGQEQNGEYWLLWADLDGNKDENGKLIKAVPAISELKEIIPSLIGCHDYEIYNSRGATEDNPKARLLIPLDKPLRFDDWNLAQQILNDKFESLDIEPDRASERAAQLCYLPNRGKIYDFCWQRDGIYFAPMQFWVSEVKQAREELAINALLMEQSKQLAMAKRAVLSAPNGFGSLSPEQAFKELVNAFNTAYTPQDWLVTAGYEQRGDTFRHPNSESGSFSASVKEIDGVLRVHSLSTNDPLYSNGQGSHDAFSVFTVLNHGGNRDAAIKDAGNNLLTIDVEPWNKVKQREYMKQQSQSDQINQISQNKGNTPFSLAQFSLFGQSEAMKKKMLEDVFVLNGLALLGDSTIIYAQFNTGKTLLTISLLIDSIKEGRIKGDDVFYINADDTFNGLVTKNQIAEKYGFNMLAPNMNGFDPGSMQGYMKQMIDDDSASGKIVVLDTLKKFTDLMDKRAGSEFMTRAREFVQAGGTLIMLAHTNKNKNAEGKVVYGGTNDIPSDADCIFTLDTVSTDSTHKTVLFENIKNRGNVDREKGATYLLDPENYHTLLESVTFTDSASVQRLKNERSKNAQRDKDKEAIEAVVSCINFGITTRKDIVSGVQEETGLGRDKVTAILHKYTGKNLSDGSLWSVNRGLHGTARYSLLCNEKIATEKEYREAKTGIYK